MTTIRIKNPTPVIAYCRQNIGPQRYHLHNAIGGEGWRIATSITDRVWQADIVDEHQATIIALKYSAS